MQTGRDRGPFTVCGRQRSGWHHDRAEDEVKEELFSRKIILGECLATERADEDARE